MTGDHWASRRAYRDHPGVCSSCHRDVNARYALPGIHDERDICIDCAENGGVHPSVAALAAAQEPPFDERYACACIGPQPGHERCPCAEAFGWDRKPKQEPPAKGDDSVFGLPVIVDERMPPGRVEIRPRPLDTDP